MESNISKDFRVSVCVTIEEADIILNALAEKALRVEDLRKSMYDSVNSQVKMVMEIEEDKKEKNKRKGRKNK